jgi:hypothetical protein
LNRVSTRLVFEEDERNHDDSLMLLLEGVNKLDPDEKHVIREIIVGMIVKSPNQTNGGRLC